MYYNTESALLILTLLFQDLSKLINFFVLILTAAFDQRIYCQFAWMSQETEENLSLLHFSQTFYLPFQLLFVLALGLLLSSINIIEQGVDINGIKNNESEIICHFRAALEGIIDF